MRRIRLATPLSVDELEQRYRAAHEPHERTWWQILWLLARGQLAKDIAQSTGYTRTWIGQIAKRSNAEGPAGMGNKQRTTPRRPPRMLTGERAGGSCGWRRPGPPPPGANTGRRGGGAPG